ncbi:hypothetical protein QBC34DRAFT_441252 [Podospora aff. communis PSN243]|uniref:Microbial-type PARG catalytic domain-containing protein n=1 Tax=Podospora aff. communis PSN243 TaxID=3040156 RepID=A0AAV9GD79_9PEZI|nr:hypothetical protein QBC34DRAFT_441252 [Podospora aff. communis PSN243]
MGFSRNDLMATVRETLDTLADHLNQLRTYDPNDCPSHPEPATIRVVNDDTLNAAIQLITELEGQDYMYYKAKPRPAVLNFANPRKPGRGWQNGAIAQEEAICYRSSLALSLHPKHYPLDMDEALYSPYVLVVRGDMASGHLLLDDAPEALPVVSVLTVAALHKPPVKTFVLRNKSWNVRARAEPLRRRHWEKHVFRHDRDRGITKAKMRLALRMAASNRHDSLVLGALGCGVYQNPPEDVAHCWLEVLREDEFSGNWWRRIWFAVYDPKNEGNYEIFDRVLSGKEV